MALGLGLTARSCSMALQTNSRRTQVAPNWFFFSGEMGTVVKGVRYREEPNPELESQIPLPTMSIGPDWAKWRKVIRALVKDAPNYKDDKIWRGSVVKDPSDSEGKRDVMVTYRDEEANYALIRTGVRYVERAGTKSKANFWTELAERGVEKGLRHGAYSFHKEALQGRSVRVATAEDIELIAAGKMKDIRIQTNPNDFGTVEATKVGNPITLGRNNRQGFPDTVFILWRMPFGAVLLVRDVDGRMSRLVSTKFGVDRVDATGYEDFYEELDFQYHEALKTFRSSPPGTKAASA
ncbi:hypothetical protein A2704_00510 [Candidatus Kaiserbacteria bacterium RIFCSPHIGHO2_01_FULL_54_36b]|uniref:Uncharacterized protein n=1 Tax=Candidatus Kaiserbacteria bacterium RIFCSPHIGHO2_01_FULL_54_36b TaxID=1798483 RepID=A0A1F6CHX0_9BACT|nr:MAG: hypothetical protein A2704_00510 [Candidatus Kaiserbacteria bacterium RIFCSPHIGHO2_01_FULL_54_36b]